MSYDPKNMAGPHLAREGRSTSAELFRARSYSHGVLANKVQVAGWGDVIVMPRSLWKFIPGHANQPGKWDLFQMSELALTSEEAHNIAEMALELDGRRVFRLWRDSGITVGGRSRKTIVLDPERCASLRYNYVVVLWGDAARKLWSQSSPKLPDCLCNCTPFSLWAGCEHQQCARAMMDGSFSLTTPGQNRGGRGHTNIVHHGVRSTCASKLRWAAARRAKETKKTTAGKDTQRLHNAVAWSYQLTTLADKKGEASKAERVASSSAKLAHACCGYCNSIMPEDAKFCSQCGAAVAECTSCKATLGRGAKFCSVCGHRVGSSACAASSGLLHTTKRKRIKSSSSSSCSSSQPQSKRQDSVRATGHRISCDISGSTNGRWQVHHDT